MDGLVEAGAALLLMAALALRASSAGWAAAPRGRVSRRRPLGVAPAVPRVSVAGVGSTVAGGDRAAGDVL